MIKVTGLILFCLSFPLSVWAEDYDIDIKGMHAAIDFRIQHLGYSWMSGRFNRFEGTFSYDENNPTASNVSVVIETKSIDTNHAERDKHLRGEAYLNVRQFPKASFVSTSFEPQANGQAILWGNFTLRGVTKPLKVLVSPVGHGYDPWGGFRRGFVGTTHFNLTDYGISIQMLGKHSNKIELTLSIEGVRK